MYNPATMTCNELNEFTRTVWQLGNGGWGRYYVRLRNGTLIRPIKAAEDETCQDAFGYESKGGLSYRWNLDGTSITRPDYDMMEIVSV